MHRTMNRFQTCFAAAAGLLLLALGGCRSGCCPDGQAAGVGSRYVVLRGTVVDEQPGEPRQIFVDTHVVAVPRGQDLSAALQGAPVEGSPGVWLAERPFDPAELRARRLEVLQAPKLLVLEEQEGSIFVGEMDEDVVTHGFTMRVIPTVADDVLTLALRYADWKDGRKTWQLPETSFVMPEGRTAILAVRPPDRP